MPVEPGEPLTEREIEIVAQLNHPNIISVFHSGRTPDRRQFYVMDYVHGEPLDRYVRDSRARLKALLKRQGVASPLALAARVAQRPDRPTAWSPCWMSPGPNRTWPIPRRPSMSWSFFREHLQWPHCILSA